MIQGYCEPEFAGVADVLRRQVRRSGRGAAVCVYHRNRKVVDLWAGSRNGDGDPWRADTLAMSFSTTKGVVATALHVLVDRGLLDYEDPVAKHWPEFAQNGKEHVTVRDVLSHRAGLPQIRPLIDRVDRIMDWDYMVRVLERARPRLRPGGDAAYHAFTFGWLAGELIQRAARRPLGEVIRTEIAEPLRLDGMYIGTQDPKVRARMASLGGMQPGAIVSNVLASRRLLGGLGFVTRTVGLPIDPLLVTDALIPADDASLVFEPRVLDAPVPAANGIFTARSLARLYACLANGGELQGVRLLSRRTVARATEVQTRRVDRVIMLPMHWRLGFHSAFTTAGRLETGFGHFGYGGSGAWADPARELAFAMVNNRLGGSPLGDLRIAELGTATLRAAREARRRRPLAASFAGQPVY